MRKSRLQVQQLKDLNKEKTYSALGYAWKLRPVLGAMLIEGLSQRAMAARLNELRIPVPSEKRSGLGRKKVTRKWNLIQVQRLLRQCEIVTEKMRWNYRWSYIKEHEAWMRFADSTTLAERDKAWKDIEWARRKRTKLPRELEEGVKEQARRRRLATRRAEQIED